MSDVRLTVGGEETGQSFGLKYVVLCALVVYHAHHTDFKIGSSEALIVAFHCYSQNEKCLKNLSGGNT